MAVTFLSTFISLIILIVKATTLPLLKQALPIAQFPSMLTALNTIGKNQEIVQGSMLRSRWAKVSTVEVLIAAKLQESLLAGKETSSWSPVILARLNASMSVNGLVNVS